MIRLKLFALFIGFALLSLVKPRKCLEMLEAADNWTEIVRRRALRASIHHNGPPDHAKGARQMKAMFRVVECALPPPGWRCTRAAGHEGPCAAVATHTSPGPL